MSERSSSGDAAHSTSRRSSRAPRPRSRLGFESENLEDDQSPRTPSRTSRTKRTAFDALSPFSDSESETDDLIERPRKISRRTLSHVSIWGPAFPLSAYEGWEPLLRPSLEHDAIADLKEAFNELHATDVVPPDYIYFDLHAFSIYRTSNPRHGQELCSLDRLQNRNGCNEFLVDGILSVAGHQRYVQGVLFRTVAVDYDDVDVVGMADRACIQSPAAERNGIWYRLGQPSPEYRRFYEPFLWLAQFTKFFVDFLSDRDRVTLADFLRSFYGWLYSQFSADPNFQSWLAQCQLRDFRTTVNAHIGFLWKECYSIDDKDTGLCKHPIWAEVDPMRLRAIPERANMEKMTVVTPFAYECFKRMYFRDQMTVRDMSNPNVLRAVCQRKEALGLTPFGGLQTPELSMPTPRSPSQSELNGSLHVSAGDVVVLPPDPDSQWQASKYYAYVQDVRSSPRGAVLDVIWLYQPCDTTLGNSYYPFKDELFMSDNCSCGKDAVHISEVQGKVDVDWFTRDPTSVSGLFVRQKFRTVHEEDTYDFVAIHDKDFRCTCATRTGIFEDCRSKYLIGDTVLVREYNSEIGEDSLEPAQVVDFNLVSRQVVLRKLQKKTETGQLAHPNELLLTNEVSQKPPSKVIRKCHVLFFDADVVQEGLPCPYDRKGAGDYYFIITPDNYASDAKTAGNVLGTKAGLNNITNASEIGECFPPLSEGWNPTVPPPFTKLRGIGIFCGGGNFDRGLEEAGAVKFRYAVDWAEKAIYSYRANLDSTDDTELFFGSVNDCLAAALEESNDLSIARPGDVDFISAGSPCPGFSRMQTDQYSEDSLRNASMVASVVSFVDFYAPQYCILENVVSMTHAMGTGKCENVFAQILAALVAMGYQVQQFLMDAWSSGSCQARTRVFIVASAPGLAPWPTPAHTHAHPPELKMMGKALGKSSNGKPFGRRRDDYTPFQHVSPERATSDLPNIGDSQPQLCVRLPDHRTPSEETAQSRARMALIPLLPRGMGIVQAGNLGLLAGEPQQYFSMMRNARKASGSKTLSRVYPDGLIPTVLTHLNLMCYRTGRSLHWDEHRALTIHELRRAQGFLDCEVIIGSPLQQVTIIGNSVDRNVALALGLSLRESWLMTHQNTLTEESSGQFDTTISRKDYESIKGKGRTMSTVRVPVWRTE